MSNILSSSLLNPKKPLTSLITDTLSPLIYNTIICFNLNQVEVIFAVSGTSINHATGYAS